MILAGMMMAVTCAEMQADDGVQIRCNQVPAAGESDCG